MQIGRRLQEGEASCVGMVEDSEGLIGRRLQEGEASCVGMVEDSEGLIGRRLQEGEASCVGMVEDSEGLIGRRLQEGEASRVVEDSEVLQHPDRQQKRGNHRSCYCTSALRNSPGECKLCKRPNSSPQQP